MFGFDVACAIALDAVAKAASAAPAARVFRHKLIGNLQFDLLSTVEDALRPFPTRRAMASAHSWRAGCILAYARMP